MTGRPLARSIGLIQEPLGEELLVFDEDSNRAYSLNATATAVWRACDGTRTRDQLATDCTLDAAVVDLTLETLAASDLLIDFVAPPERVSRRAVLRRTAIAGVGLGAALPVIRSITAPSVAMAASGGLHPGRHPGNGGLCRRDSDCPSTSTCFSVVGFCYRHTGQSCYSQDMCSYSGGASCPPSTGVCGSYVTQ
jgi:hypothetical protein